MKYEDFVGKILDGRYRITDVVGVGGMAVVFKAVDLTMNRTVAVKVLKSDSANAEKSIQRFLNESKAVSMLSHPNIVSIYDVNVKNEIKYIVMEYVEGTTLKDYMSGVGRLGWKEALHYTEQILRALAHAHEKGIVHRDVKPQNILLLKDGTIKVADFGIAKIASGETITDGETAIGTVHYISPEQAGGKEVTAASDIYSVGIMLYEMVTGKLPFDADTPVSVALMHVTDEPVAPKDIVPSLPDGLQFIIMQAIAKDPDARFDSCNEMIDYIRELVKDPEVVFAPIPAGARHAKQSGKADPSQRRAKTDKEVRTKRKHHTMMPVIFGVLFAFLIVAVVSIVPLAKTVWALVYNTGDGVVSDSDFVIVENLVGSIYSEELYKEYYSKGYRIKTTYDLSADYEENEIISQSVREGERRRSSGFSIVLHVCRTPKPFELADYVNMNYRDVNKELSALGLKVKMLNVSDDFVPVDFVVGTDPKAGESVLPGDLITIKVSKGAEVINKEVPVLTMMPLAKAKELIKQYEFSEGEITYAYSDDVQSGYVISQSVSAGSSAPVGFTKIDLEVSKGPDPSKPKPKPEPEPKDDGGSDGEDGNKEENN